jgi:two-component system sensor histidine kinase KdpD
MQTQIVDVRYNRGVKPDTIRLILRYAAAAAAVLVITLIYRRIVHVNPTTVALTFLLAVLLISANWGLRCAVFTSFIAALAFNYYFLPPIGTFTIQDPQNWVALFAFLATAVIASELSERARRETRNANDRRKEVERLYGFSQQLLSTDNMAELLNAIPRYIVESFAVRSAAIWLPNRTDVYRSGSTVDGLELHDLQLIAARGESRLEPHKQLSFVPLRMGVRVVGSLGVSGAALSRETLDAMGSLIAISIERAGAMERLSRSEAARASEQLRSVLLDSVTHAFRTPLTAIKASVTSMLSSSALDDSQRTELLTVINEESDRLNRLVGEAAEMAQLEAHKVELELGNHEMQEVVDSALEKSKPALAHHPVEVRLGSLPAVRMDMARIAEVLTQLLENAAKYSPPQSPIHITGEVQNGMLMISVADRGPGIEDMEQSLIFEKFYRGRNQRLQVQGTGMGLAIAKAIIEAHNGQIGVTSQPGHGSVFYFTLPVA